MPDTMNTLALLGSVLGILGAIGGGSAYFYGQRSKGIIALLRDENDILQDQNTRLKSEIVVRDEQNASLLKRVATLEAQVKTLSQVVTSGPAIAELAKKMDDGNREIMKQLSNIAKA